MPTTMPVMGCAALVVGALSGAHLSLPGSWHPDRGLRRAGLELVARVDRRPISVRSTLVSVATCWCGRFDTLRKHEVGIVPARAAIFEHRAGHPLLERTDVVGHPQRRTHQRQHNAADHRLVDGALVGHLLPRFQYRIEPVADHLRLVPAHRLDEPEPTISNVDDSRAEQDRIPESRIRPNATPR